MREEVILTTPRELISAKQEPEVVDVPARLVLALDGIGGPSEPAFSAAISAIYGIAYTFRFARKKSEKPMFKVGTLEGEWRAEGHDLLSPEIPPRDAWRWRLQISVPSDVTGDELEAVIVTATTKRGGKLEGSEEARRIQLVKTEPSRFARVLHIGPYSSEPESFAKIAQLLASKNLNREPWHVEVYLSDPNRTAPEKLKTVLLTKVY